MPGARDELLENIGGVKDALNAPALRSLAPLPSNRTPNKMADLLRRGLYVVAFNAIEDYLKKRATEHFLNLPVVSTLDFDDLPPGLRKAAVIDALKNGIREAGYDKANEMQIIRAVAGAVASTANRQQYAIHEFSVLRSGSNVSADDISAALGKLHIDHPWDQMQDLLDDIGTGAPIKARFSSCLLKRHAAAHDGQPIDHSDLVEIADLAIPLCFAFDVIFSAGMTRIADNTPTPDNGSRVKFVSRIAVRYIGQRGNRWCRLNRNKQPFRYFTTRTDAVQHALRNLPMMGAVATLGPFGEITSWHLADSRHPNP